MFKRSWEVSISRRDLGSTSTSGASIATRGTGRTLSLSSLSASCREPRAPTSDTRTPSSPLAWVRTGIEQACTRLALIQAHKTRGWNDRCRLRRRRVVTVETSACLTVSVTEGILEGTGLLTGTARDRTVSVELARRGREQHRLQRTLRLLMLAEPDLSGSRAASG